LGSTGDWQLLFLASDSFGHVGAGQLWYL